MWQKHPCSKWTKTSCDTTTSYSRKRYLLGGSQHTMTSMSRLSLRSSHCVLSCDRSTSRHSIISTVLSGLQRQHILHITTYISGETGCTHKKGKAQYPVHWTAQSTLPPDRPVHSDNNSASLGSIQSRCDYCLKTIHSHVHHLKHTSTCS